MKQSILPLSLFILARTACGTREVKESRETVIEKPVVSQETREIIVEKPSVTREIEVEKQVSLTRSCSYASTTYSSNSPSCQNGYQYLCMAPGMAATSPAERYGDERRVDGQLDRSEHGAPKVQRFG